MNTNQLVELFRQQLSLLSDCPLKAKISNDYQLNVEHGRYLRMRSTVNLHLAEQIYYYQRENCHLKEDLINGACNALRDLVSVYEYWLDVFQDFELKRIGRIILIRKKREK